MSKHKPARASSALRYVGNGRWIRGVPARDLEPDEAARFNTDVLVASGLYRTAEGSAASFAEDRSRALPFTEAASDSAADQVSADDGKE